MTKYIDGKEIAVKIKTQVKNHIDQLEKKPRFAVIQVGSQSASEVYVRNKIKACKEVGIETVYAHLDEGISEQSLLGLVEGFNQSSDFHGILVQLPLPKHISIEPVIEAIDPLKDVDGFHPLNVGRLTVKSTTPYLHPCTPWGIVHILDTVFPKKNQESGLRAKRIVVIGQSLIVGRPLSIMLQNEGATVTMCDKFTHHLYDHLRNADIIITATGVPGLIDRDMVKKINNPNLTIVDAGITKVDGKIVGDTNKDVYDLLETVTPVPGGVGPVTIAFLIRNILKAFCIQNNLPVPVIK
ncbi:MAG: bifunctional 5,10-methylenetetrahydrofolate dehydrogenase/5,10-methenyltetrahydrofolate cyclohydrolase [Spirochaetes bacterium]|nr:bifunctional 5,10-methylenetetrahydrofolate dehydrogenase/5,10-methenyltetrahydrofolate cyclohydrolase [Spirochaetota bacterium]